MQTYGEALKEIISLGDLEKFKSLLKGRDINHPLRDGWTILHHVCAEGQDSFLDYLFNRGASVNSSFEFFTPLMAVCSSHSGHEDKLVKCAQFLIEHKADLEALSKTKVTPLMMACDSGKEKLVLLLLESHCDVNKVDNDGYSALHLACMNKHASIVKMLLDFGADKQMKDSRGRLPIDVAVSKGAEEIIKILDPSYQEANPEPPTKVTYEVDKSPFERLLTVLPSYTNSSGKDGFHQDIAELLCGMRLEQKSDLFRQKNISLAQFLNITNEELKSLGLYFSSHRSRVIVGNKRFISQGWGEHSLPPENNRSIMDVCRALANGVKHIHILFCTLLYCNNRISFSADMEGKKIEDLFDITLRAHRQTKTLIKELQIIQGHVERLEKVDKVKPVDLVLPMKPRGHGHYSGKIVLVTVLCAFLVWKGNLFNMLKK